MDAIFEATIQLLTRPGAENLTTTRVAERAGVSVGTLYQYFPNKQALIYALNERYLVALTEKIEATCRAQEGESAKNMLKALIDTYWQAKTERPEVTRALYRSVADLDNTALIETFAQRVDAATTAMFSSASDVDFANLAEVNLTLVTVIFGTVRNAFERGLDTDEADRLHGQLLLMCEAYLVCIGERINHAGGQSGGQD
ncbi:TetR/AcrR family transcriptional regulator [uncultured Martelella sp.]|uniref:TetR/AcrR family transcriptional regulator n=1 Tax=uncultured Martelella sp. TaxID=392331 RepID=UPI0029C6B6AD|nr:TetR/AcrR family transcriptional regulator [uncultured Martelella sp.]